MALIPILELAYLEERKSLRKRIKRVKRVDAFDLPENEFLRLYRVNKEVCAELFERLRPALQPRSFVKNALSVERRVLCALRLYAEGSYQKSLANDELNSMSQQSVSNCLRKVTEAINNLMLQEVVKFPVSESERCKVKEEFFNFSGFPGVLGAIDCTHVAIISPPDDREHNPKNYINRKKYYSINVQLVCDVNLRILSVSARFPGSTQDWYIWQMSLLRNWFQINSVALKDSWLLGDSAYPLEPWLMKPSDGSSHSEQIYNIAHEKGRSVIKKCNRALKSRFQCLLRNHALNYNPTVASSIINACVVLHNMCVSKGLPLIDEDIEVDEPFNTGSSSRTTEQAESIRKSLINSFD